MIFWKSKEIKIGSLLFLINNYYNCIINMLDLNIVDSWLCVEVILKDIKSKILRNYLFISVLYFVIKSN